MGRGDKETKGHELDVSDEGRWWTVVVIGVDDFTEHFCPR